MFLLRNLLQLRIYNKHVNFFVIFCLYLRLAAQKMYLHYTNPFMLGQQCSIYRNKIIYRATLAEHSAQRSSAIHVRSRAREWRFEYRSSLHLRRGFL